MSPVNPITFIINSRRFTKLAKYSVNKLHKAVRKHTYRYTNSINDTATLLGHVFGRTQWLFFWVFAPPPESYVWIFHTVTPQCCRTHKNRLRFCFDMSRKWNAISLLSCAFCFWTKEWKSILNEWMSEWVRQRFSGTLPHHLRQGVGNEKPTAQ